jgi:hypothetical protein
LLGIAETGIQVAKMPMGFVPEVVQPVVPRNAAPAVLPPPPSAKLHNKVRPHTRNHYSVI